MSLAVDELFVDDEVDICMYDPAKEVGKYQKQPPTHTKPPPKKTTSSIVKKVKDKA